MRGLQTRQRSTHPGLIYMLFCRPMAIYQLGEMTWTEVSELDVGRTVALLPVGAIEAHGPHLALDTDGVIAHSMARSASRILSSRNLDVVLLPAVEYSSAAFAAQFPGTISIDGQILTGLIVGIASSLAGWNLAALGIANAHLDPGHLRSLHEAEDEIERSGRLRVAFPDLTRRPWGSRLTDEFKSGACHAGQFETSVVMASAPARVREATRSILEANPRSLSEAIGAGLESFEEAGGPQAYFGDPAAATESEGAETIEVLGQILADAVVEAIGDD